MIEAARLGIYVGAQTGDAKSGLEGVSAMVEKAGAKMTGWGLKMSALVSAPLIAIGKQALGAGSDLAESASKVDVVFKESAGVVEAFAATAADSFGIAEQAALETTGTFGNLFTSMGLGREASAAMSVDLVELAADLASFNNIDSSIALEKLRAGLVGEAEPLRTLGVNLSEAGAKAKAMAMGLAESEKALTAADLVQARYALILEQTTNAQGDFARTAGGLANSQRILQAQLQNVAATLGQMLLPVALRMVQAFSSLLQRFQGLSPATQRFIVIAGGIAAAIGPALLTVGSLLKVVSGLSGAFAAIGAAVSPVLLPIAGVAAAVAALALAWKTNFLGIRDVVGPVIERIVSVIGTAIKVFQMWRDQTGSVSQGIVGGLNSIGLMVPSLKGFTSGLAEIIQTVAHFLTEGELLTDYFVTLPQPIQNAVLSVLNFMGNLVDGVRTALSTMRDWWDAHWPAMQTAVSTWWSNVQPKLAEAYTAIRDKVGQAVVDVRGWWDAHWPAMQTAVSTWWSNVQQKLADAYTAIRDKVGQAVVDVRGWWDEHWPAMQTAVSTWWTNIKDKLDDAATAINDKVGQAVVDLKDSFEENWPKARTAIETWWTDVQPKLDEAIDYFSNQLVVAVQGVATAFEENWPKAQAAVSDWWTETKSSLEEAATQIGTTLPEAMDAMTEKFGPLIEAQKKYYDLFPQLIELSESFRDVGDAIKEKMGEWIEFGWSVLLEKLQEIGKYLAETFQPAWDTLKKVYDDTATAISTVLIGAYNSIRDKFNEVKPIADLFAGAMSAISGAIDAISSAIQSAITWLSNLAEKIRNLPSPPAWFVGHSPPPLANWFTAIGEAAGTVATEGIPALAQALNQDLSATGMIQGIITDANTVLGIASPSTVFMEIGIQMIEGLLAGIDSTRAEAAAKIAGFLRTIVGAFDALVEFMEQLDSYDLSGVRGRWDARGISVFTAWITGLADDMAVMAQALATVSQGIETSVQEAVSTYLSNMGGVTDALAEVLDVLVLLDEVVETGLMARLEAWRASSELSRWVNVLAEVLGVMARALGTVAADLSSEIQTAIREFSATLVEVIEPLSAMIGLWEDLDRAVEEGIAYPEHLTTTLDDILRSYGELVQVLNRWTSAEYSASLPEITYEVQELVDDLGTLIAPFEEMLGFWARLQETIVARRGWSADLLPMFIDILSSYGDIVSAITAALAQEVRGFDPDLLTQEVIDFTTRLDGLLAPFAEMLAFWEKLDAAIANNRGWSNSDFDVLWNILKTYSQVLAALHVAMSGEDRFLLGITPDLVTDELVAFVARLNGLLSPFSAMIDFWEDLDAAIARGRGWSNADLAVLWDILKTYAQVLAVLHVAMSGTDRDLLGITPELVTDELIAFTARLNGLLAPFSAMIDFWAKLATAAVPPNLPALGATLDAMLEGYSAVAERLTTTIETFYGLQEVPVIEVTEVMTTFAAQLSGLLAPFTAMADFWTKLDGVAAPEGDFGALVDRALQMYRQIAERLTTTIETFYGLQEVPVIEVTEVMTAFAAQLSGLLAPFSAMIDFWAKLAEMAAPDVDFAAVIEEMLGYYSELVTALETLLADTVAAGGSLEIAPEIIEYTQAISAISSALIAPLDYLAELQTAIEDGVLGGAGIPDVATALDQLRQFMIQVVTAMNDLMLDPEVGALDETAEEFAAWISSSIGTFSTALNLVSQLATAVASKAFEPFTTVEQVGLNIEVQLQYLRDAIRQIALAIDLLMDDPDLAGLSNTSAAFATWFNASVGPFSTALDLVSRLSQAVTGEVFEPFTTSEQAGLNIETQLQFLRDAIRQMAASIRLMMDDPELQGLDETVDGFATRIGAIATGLGGAVSFLVELGAWEAATGLEAQINQFAITWVMVLERLAQISSETRALADEEMRRFASAAGDIGAGLQRAIGFLVDLGAWKRAENLEELIDDLVRVTEYTLLQLADVVDDWTDEGLQLVTTFGQAVGSVMGGLQAAFQMAAEAPESWGVDQGLWDAFFTWVTGVFTQFADYVAAWAALQEDPGNLAGLVGSVGSALGSLMAGLQAATDFELSAEWTAPAPALWDAFFLWVTGVFDAFSAYVAAWAVLQEDPDNSASLIGAVAGALSGVMQGLQSALQLAAAFPQTWAQPDPAQFQAFIDWVMGIFADLYDWVVLNLPDSVAAAANLPVVQALGSAMGAVFGGLQAALDLSQGFWFTEPNNGLWTAFQDWVLGVFLDLHDWVLANFPSSPADATATFAPVMAFAQALDAITGGLSSALDLLRNVMDTDTGSYQQSEGFTLFQDRVGWLMQGIDTVLDAFLTWVVSGETGWLDTAAAFAGAVGAVFDVLSQALGVFGTLTDEDIPSLDQINAFVDAVLNLFGAFAGGLLTAGGEVGSAVAGLGTTVAGLPGYLPDAATVQFWGYDLAYQLGYGLRNNDLGGDVSAMEAQLRSWLAGAFGASDYGSLRWEMAQMGADLGWALVAGIAGGIDPLGWSGQLYDWMNQAIQALVDYIIAQINGDLGIASPSRVTFGIGLFIPAGLAEGIRAGIPVVGSAMEELFAAVGTRMGGIDGFGVQPSSLAVTQGQRIEVVVSGDVSVGGERLSVAQREDIAQVIIQRLRARG